MSDAGATARTNADKRERILVAASELFSRQDFSTVLVDDIAASAQVAKGTVYYHFGSKDALYGEVVTTRLEHLVSVLRESCRQRDDVRLNVRRVAVHVMSFMLKYRAFFRIWKREEGWVCEGQEHPWCALRKQLHGVLADQLARGIELGIIRPVDPALAAAHVFGAIDGAVYRNLGRSNAEPEMLEERDRLDEFIWRALRKDADG